MHDTIVIPQDLSASNAHELIEIEVGDLHLPSGKVIVSDPFFTSHAKSFVRQVSPGVYPVKLYLRKIEEAHFRVAFAKVKVKPHAASRWILAITEGMKLEELQNLKKDEYFGFPVDAGLGCFVDALTNAQYVKEIDDFYRKDKSKNFYDDCLAKEFEAYSGKNEYSSSLGDWNNHFVNGKKDSNVIMFSSGWGDGYYPAYWGYNAADEVVELTIDFLVTQEE